MMIFPVLLYGSDGRTTECETGEGAEEGREAGKSEEEARRAQHGCQQEEKAAARRRAAYDRKSMAVRTSSNLKSFGSLGSFVHSNSAVLEPRRHPTVTVILVPHNLSA